MWQRYWNSAWQTLTYDYENRLVSVSGSGTGSFAYDADGNRVWQDVDGTEIHYVWDWVESGTVYYYFGGRKVVMRNVSGLTYLYADQVSSTTNTSNAQPSSQRYYPYGDKRGTNSVVTPYQYTGQRWEDAIGLYFYQARWYDAARRRFIQPDSIVPEPGNPQALNRYSYCLNNPVKYTDPSGHDPVEEFVYGLTEFLGGALSQWAYSNLGDPRLAPKMGESEWARSGREFGAQLSLMQGFWEIGFGANTSGKGLVMTGSGAGAIEGVGVTAVGGVIVVHGGMVVGRALAGMMMLAETDPGSSPLQPTHPVPPYPGDDPTVAPGPDWEWKGRGPVGSKEGSWTRGKGKTKESLHPDVTHGPPEGPHYDWEEPGTRRTWRLYPDGSVEYKQ